MPLHSFLASIPSRFRLASFLVYLGVIFSLLTAVIYTVKGYRAGKRAIEHPEEEDEDFLNPEIVEGDDAS